jgi:Ser/Thr protein kinase RdoA (MazF antagonist)
MGAADRLATWSFGCLKLEGEPMDRLIATIAERFGLEVAAARRMDGGDEAAVWWLRTDRGAFVAHANPSWRTRSELVWIHRVIAHAAERLPEAVTPLAADDGETVFLFDRHPISVSPFVEGDWLDREDLDQVQASARLLARLHAAMADWRGGPRPPSSPANPGTWDPNDDPPEPRGCGRRGTRWLPRRRRSRVPVVW